MTFIDWFSGVGGFTRGMELAGHKCIGHCEIDKFAEASYRSMHCITEEQREYLATLPMKDRQKEIIKEEYLNGEWYADDVSTVRGQDIPTADCWCFGFPCQDISIAGLQRGFAGDRSSLFFRVMHLLGELREGDRPEYLFIENVKNLISIHSGFDFGRVLASLDEGGYDAEWTIINSKDHGVPQNRERVFIIGHSRDRGRREILPFGESNTEASIIQGQQGVRVIGNYMPSGHEASRIVDVDGIAPTVKENHGVVTGIVEPLNAHEDGTARTIKAQYQQSSVANFIRQDGFGATGVIANTICAGDRVQVGCYPIDGGGGTKSQRISQGINAGLSNEVKPTKTDIASTLCARDYKGPSYRDARTVVAVYEDTD